MNGNLSTTYYRNRFCAWLEHFYLFAECRNIFFCADYMNPIFSFNDKRAVWNISLSAPFYHYKQDFATKTEQFDETSIGAFYGNEKITDTPVIISTYASMKKMIEKVGLENIGLVLCDEAHHILSENRIGKRY